MAGRIVPPMVSCWYGCGHTQVLAHDVQGKVIAYEKMEAHYKRAHEEDLDSILMQIDAVAARDD